MQLSCCYWFEVHLCFSCCDNCLLCCFQSIFFWSVFISFSVTVICAVLCYKKPRFRVSKAMFWSHSGATWMFLACSWAFFSLLWSKKQSMVSYCYCYFDHTIQWKGLWLSYTHFYSFVSIETLSPGQACFLVLHKPLTVIRNTHRHGYFRSAGFLFLGMIICNNYRKMTKPGFYCYF